MQVTSNLISYVFCTFRLLTEEDMASCTRTFWKKKSAEEEGNLIQNVTPKSIRACFNLIFFFLGWQKGRKYKNLAIEHCTFTSDKS